VLAEISASNARFSPPTGGIMLARLLASVSTFALRRCQQHLHGILSRCGFARGFRRLVGIRQEQQVLKENTRTQHRIRGLAESVTRTTGFPPLCPCKDMLSSRNRFRRSPPLASDLSWGEISAGLSEG
jgi:hypothetical protein